MFLLVFVQCYVVFLQLAISKVYPFHFLIIVFLSDSANWKNCIFVVTHKEIRYLMIKCPKINNIFYNSKFLRRNLKNCWIVELLNRWIVELSTVSRPLTFDFWQKTKEQRRLSASNRNPKPETRNSKLETRNPKLQQLLFGIKKVIVPH